MKTRNLLLPHSCQIAGWALWGLWLVMALVHIFVLKGNRDFYNGFPHFLILIYGIFGEVAPYLAIILLCLSREKTEDEYVHYIRSVSVFSLALFLLVTGLFSFAFERLFCGWGLSEVSAFTVWLRTYFSLTPVAAILYLLIFKGLLFYNWIKSRVNG